jgi:hypothetical protein
MAPARTRYDSRVPAADIYLNMLATRALGHGQTHRAVGQFGQSREIACETIICLTESIADVADDRATSLSRPVRMLGLLCLRPTASPVGKLPPRGLGARTRIDLMQVTRSVLSWIDTNRQASRGPSALPQDRPLQARKSLLSWDSHQGSVASLARGPKRADIRHESQRSAASCRATRAEADAFPRLTG